MPSPAYAGHAGGQAEQCGARAAAALQDAGARPRRDGGRQQHRLDAAAEAAPRLGVAHPAIEQMAVGHGRRAADGLQTCQRADGAPELFRRAILA